MLRHLVLIGFLALAGCSQKDHLTVITNEDRVSLLEARADLNDANDALLEARVTSLEGRVTSVENQVIALDNTLNNYMSVTDADLQDLHNTDAQLSARISAHTVAIAVLGGEIVLLKAKDILLNSKIESLKARVVLIENELQAARATYPTLNARLNAMQSNLSTLNSSVNSLQNNVNALNTFAALQGIANVWLQYQINQLDNRIDSNTANISSLVSQVNSLTNTVNGFSSTYLTQTAASQYVQSLEAQLQAVNAIASSAVTQQQLADAIAAIELTPGPQGPAGQNGSNGAPGAQGPQGQPGVNGSTAGMVAVKLCAADNATHPEYGFVVGDSIYAVYYGVVNGTLSAFLARLNAGSYVTTNDNSPCAFTVSYSGGNSYLDGVQVNPVVSTPSTGTCSIVNRNQSDNSYQVTTSGTILNSSGKLEIKLLGSANVTGHNYSGGGATVSTSGNTYTFKPTAGVATSFLIYKSSNGTFSTSTVTDGNNNVITCTVTN